MRFAEVAVPGELGKMPAWRVGGAAPTWAIVVHGINGDPQEGLRLLPALTGAGLTSLLITYREDLGAPPSPDGLHHMGLTEWRDLEAAARYALSHGARDLVLIGYSMGGSLVTQFMQHSALAPRVIGPGPRRASPQLEEDPLLPLLGNGPAGRRRDPGRVGDRRPDRRRLGRPRRPSRTPKCCELPILLFHGTEDDVVPISTSDELAADLPRWVTYFRAPRAGHTEAWNVAPKLYESRLISFLGRVGASSR